MRDGRSLPPLLTPASRSVVSPVIAAATSTKPAARDFPAGSGMGAAPCTAPRVSPPGTRVSWPSSAASGQETRELGRAPPGTHAGGQRNLSLQWQNFTILRELTKHGVERKACSLSKPGPQPWNLSARVSHQAKAATGVGEPWRPGDLSSAGCVSHTRRSLLGALGSGQPGARHTLPAESWTPASSCAW